MAGCTCSGGAWEWGIRSGADIWGAVKIGMAVERRRGPTCTAKASQGEMEGDLAMPIDELHFLYDPG